MQVTVIIPTYHRPYDLARCFEALKKQTRLADEVIVVVRDTDTETWAFLDSFDASLLHLRSLKVTVTGVVAALNIGLHKARGDIIAITDDDAAPYADWLERIEKTFLADQSIGGLGGKDIVQYGTKILEGERKIVGKVQWFGRVIGNHHLGVGGSREVDVLKGVNMSYRKAAIKGMQFDERMRGSGAQVHFELAFSLTLKQAGWKLVYDPNLIVNHYRGQRFDEDQRDKFNYTALVNHIHNETLSLLEYFSPLQRAVFLVWSVFIGVRNRRGLVQCLRLIPKEGFLSLEKYLAALEGRWRGWRTWQQFSKKASIQTVESKQV
jgi:glycosyltransferase involved in cell wall biosynthesis